MTLLKNAHWNLQVDPHTGALTGLRHPEDAHGMNWVCDSSENSWFLDSWSWGLGFATGPWPFGITRWQRPLRMEPEGDRIISHYRLAAFDLRVTRNLVGKSWKETYEIHNATSERQAVWGLGVSMPFNDNYPDAASCVTRRCNAHLWFAGHTAWVCALRMGGEGPHLGCVLREGRFEGYGIQGRGPGGSNVRGAISATVPGFELAPGESHRLVWEFFWHCGWDDFFAKANESPAFLQLKVKRHTILRGEVPEIISSKPILEIESVGDQLGDRTLKVAYNGALSTSLRLQIIEPVADLIQARVAFIRDHQQENNPVSPSFGAFLPYDNEAKVKVTDSSRDDCNDGRERLGMGVLLAQSLRHWPNVETEASVKAYHTFVRTRLQEQDGQVKNDSEDATLRLYNFPLTAQFHLEMFRTFGGNAYLDDCLATWRSYYKLGGGAFYAIGILMLDTVQAFASAGRTGDADLLRTCFLEQGEHVVKNQLRLPPHEVNYEQTIVGPAVVMALECYLLTGQQHFLEGAQAMLPALESFNGRQPDHHLHEISIRHWDGFWFGKKQMWGDTFPHYWSVVTGWAFYRYWQATNEGDYRERAREILMNNLSAFSPDGSASCAYLYPDAVNGQRAQFWDPFANDQDWALVYLLQAAELDPSFRAERWSYPPERRADG